MKAITFCKLITIATVMMSGAAQAQETIRLGNLKFAHYGAVSYIKEIAPKCGIRVEERLFAKGLDVMQAIIAGELDIGTTASEAAIAGRAGGAPVIVVAGFARGGARLVARPGLNIKGVKDLKGKKVGVTRGAIQEVFEDAISNSPYSYDITPEHIQITTDTMARTGVGRMAKPPVAKDWVRTDLLDAAKKSLNVL
ncbi:ABC transporter substrate-binding protein [Massilia sp. RP-1-19]|uniref:ABC transporter substrate-binding protein n=1 Tax=Massilia polaris TaxID=2728846 RepID=A0A848HNN1_9BURK|nr:ABC transporter substrate-binding protein [Massilia polaris]NML63546.1 ABC transporter substrate-binding protein [Massilia polaris]